MGTSLERSSYPLFEPLYQAFITSHQRTGSKIDGRTGFAIALQICIVAGATRDSKGALCQSCGLAHRRNLGVKRDANVAVLAL